MDSVIIREVSTILGEENETALIIIVGGDDFWRIVRFSAGAISC